MSFVNVQLTYDITLIYCELWQFPLYTMMVFNQWFNGIPIHIVSCMMLAGGLDTMDARFE
jgi:hypothetical protein